MKTAHGGAVREAAGDAADRLCFLADALTARPSEDLEAASKRGLGRILEDIAVELAEAVLSHPSGATPPKEEKQC